jgi:hypothetical protein
MAREVNRSVALCASRPTAGSSAGALLLVALEWSHLDAAIVRRIVGCLWRLGVH